MNLVCKHIKMFGSTENPSQFKTWFTHCTFGHFVRLFFKWKSSLKTEISQQLRNQWDNAIFWFYEIITCNIYQSWIADFIPILKLSSLWEFFDKFFHLWDFLSNSTLKSVGKAHVYNGSILSMDLTKTIGYKPQTNELICYVTSCRLAASGAWLRNAVSVIT